MARRETREVTVRAVPIGGQHPVAVQSMTNTDTEDSEATLAQIERLAAAGCAIVRVAIPNRRAAESFAHIRRQTDVPLVADIHFQHQLAVAAIEAGADKVRINPGNIGSPDKVRVVADAARAAGIPVRIGVNAGSLEKEILAKHTHPTPQALYESAIHNIQLMESFGFDDIVVSIKASDVCATIEACTLLSRESDRPQHIGITESGTVRTGTIRSSVGIGTLLAQGIGDTIRVSLAGDPLQEVYVAREILKSLKLAAGPIVIACPTCGRTQIDVASLAERVEQMVAGITAPMTVAVMGCVVNGPGEAREADVGIAGGRGEGQVFRRGVAVEKVKESELLDRLWHHIQELAAERA
ncbi:MAG: flavodoxin-dependent (E)-4-hydroxy-3-methylbut-2-enyl-diphosphate synthase [Chitinivibrionales bacterium]|nr:flavodoxin-dependent (E)-4-hydroxy-3-methylbut-2-enyl-diphosphate synthase [Chitinivibrionales bacterium]